MVCILRSPELLLELPLRILTFIPTYVEFAMHRLVARIERELGLSQPAGTSGPTEAARPAFATAQPVTLIGLAIAGIYAMRK
jgi:hypothetical protein